MEYKHVITINQRAAVELGLDLDLIDLAIFDYIKGFALSSKCMNVKTEDGSFYWISHKNIQDAMPLLNIKSSQGIINRIKKLIDAGLLIKYSKCEEFGKTLYAFGPNYDKIEFFETHQQNLMGASTKVEGNNKLNNNVSSKEDTSIIDNNLQLLFKDGVSIIPPIVPQKEKKFVKPTLEQVAAYIAERNSDVNPQRFLDYYESNGWMVGRTHMKDWKAAVRTWEAKEVKSSKPIAYGNNFDGRHDAANAGATRQRDYNFEY